MGFKFTLNHQARGINRLDFITLTIFTIGLIIFGFLYTVNIARDIANLGFFLMVGGFVVSTALYGLHYDNRITTGELIEIFMWIALLMTVIVFTNTTVNYIPLDLQHEQIAFITQVQGGVLLAIGEEMFFRFLLVPLFTNLGKSHLVGILASSGAWSIYHLGVYGNSISDLALIFAVGCVFAWSMIKTRRLLPATVSHILNNIIAYGFLGG